MIYKIKIILQSMLIGLATGLIVSAYRYILEKSACFLTAVYQLQRENLFLIPCWFLLLILSGLIIGKIVIKVPIIKGSGIPQVKGVLEDKMTMNWQETLLGKFFGGVLAVGLGMSLGREGPSIQLGAAAGQGVSRIFRNLPAEEKYLITAGASAGLAGAFNAPLAGVMFALEEIHKSFAVKIILSAFTASLASDFVAQNFFGLKPIFNFLEINALPFKYYLYLFLLGIILGLGGIIFNQLIFRTQDFWQKHLKLPLVCRPVLPLLLTGLIGFVMPQVLGGGNNLIASLHGSNFLLHTLILFLIAKLLLTAVCYASSAPGGIFLPLLAIGALIGNIYSLSLTIIFQLPEIYQSAFIALAMAGYFTAIVKSPLTGIILISEMSGSFQHMLALSLVSVTAYLTTELFHSKPIYSELLERMLNAKKAAD